MIDPLLAHLLCAALVAADLLSRAWRLQLFVRATGERLRFWDAFTTNAFGEAAATLTPLRLGGQPARVFGMTRHGIPLEASLAAMGVEGVTLYGLIALAAFVLALAVAPEMIGGIGTSVLDATVRFWPWVLPLSLLAIVVWWSVRRERDRRRRRRSPGLVPPPREGVRARLRRLGELLRSVPPSVLALTLPLNAVNMATRVALLPVLALTLPQPPEVGTLVLGSFTLLYGQLFLPTPGGAGVVEAGFLAGASGDLGGSAVGLLFWWRVYSAGVGVAAGVAFGIPRYGLRPLLRALWPRRRAAENAPLSPDRPA